MSEDKKYFLKKKGEGGDFDYIDQDGISHESPLDWLWTGILGGCGCGSLDLDQMAFDVLEHFSKPPSDRKWEFISQSKEREILAHWIDEKGLIEHGTIIYGSWLTEKGKQIYKSIVDFAEK